MTNYLIYAGVGGAIIVLALLGLFVRRRVRGLNPDHFQVRWKELQKHCAKRTSWYKAVLVADELLDEALRGRKFKGKTTGERLVAAQHHLSTNESVWFGHKLGNRIRHEGLKKLSKQDTLEALSGFRQALKDLGALVERRHDPNQEESE